MMRARIAFVAAMAVVTIVASAAEAEPLRVGILRSGNVEAYNVPAAAFRASLTATVPGVVIEEHDLAGDRGRGREAIRDMRSRGVRLIFAVGAKAAYLAATEQPDVPVVFASVLDWRSYRVALGRSHVAGVALEVPGDVLVTRFKVLSPDLRKIIVVARSKSARGAVLDELVAAGRLLGVDIDVVAVSDLDALAVHANRDRIQTVVYPLADPAVYTREAYLQLLAVASEHRLPVVAFSRPFVQVGAVASIGVSYRDLGEQAAVQAQQILAGEASPAELGVAAPIGTTSYVNVAAARRIGMTLPATVLRDADDVYESVTNVTRGEFDEARSSVPPAPYGGSGDRDPWGDDIEEIEFFAVAEDIVRVASRRAQQLSRAPSIVSVLTNEDLRAHGVRNLAEALQLLPGFTHRYTNIGYYTILFRGQSEPADMLVMIDGERVNSMYDGFVDFDLPVHNIRRIEVIRGPGSALYGTNAFAGVISIYTYGADAPDAVVADGLWFPNSSAGHEDNTFAGTGYVRQSVGRGPWRLGLSATVVSSAGARLRMPLDLSGVFPPDDVRVLDDSKSRLHATATFEYGGLLSDDDSLVVAPKVMYRSQAANFGPAETLAPDSDLERTVAFAPVTYSTSLSKRWKARVHLSYGLQRVRDDVQIRADGFTSLANPIPAPDGLRKRTSYSIHTVSLEPQATVELPRVHPLWKSNTLTLGVLAEYGAISGFRYDQNYLERFGSVLYFENFSDEIKADLEAAGIGTEGFQNYNQLALGQRDADRHVYSAYAETQMELPDNPLGPTWLTAGLRLDAFSDFRAPSASDPSPGRKTYIEPNPRGAIVWDPHFGSAVRGMTLKAIYGWAFRAPSFSELYNSTDKVTDSSFRIPNENLDPQTTRATELGVEVRPFEMIGHWTGWRGHRRYANALTARFNAFHMRTEDLLAPDPLFNPAGYQVINFAGQTIMGYEAELQLRVTPSDVAFVNYSDIEATQEGDCVREQADGTCPGDRTFLSNEIREIPRRRLNLGVRVRPVGLTMELMDARRGALYRALAPLQLSFKVHTVSASSNNARVTFELLRFAFNHPGYSYADLGLAYRVDDLWIRAFVYNVSDQKVSEPLVIQLEPRPEFGYFLPRPGRRFAVSLEWLY